MDFSSLETDAFVWLMGLGGGNVVSELEKLRFNVFATNILWTCRRRIVVEQAAFNACNDIVELALGASSC